MSLAALDTQLIAAHARCDHAALVVLYAKAAECTQDETAERFYLTHAYVFALECGHERARALKSRLVELGSEA